jgi:hypothetical protein
MASQLYPIGADHILGKTTQVDIDTNTMKILFYTSTFNAAHEFVSDLTGASIVARSGALSGVTLTNGVVDANDITVTAVTGSAFTHVILYKDTGSDATSVLVAIFDISSFTPTGGDISVIWNASGLFSIA